MLCFSFLLMIHFRSMPNFEGRTLAVDDHCGIDFSIPQGWHNGRQIFVGFIPRTHFRHAKWCSWVGLSLFMLWWDNVRTWRVVRY